MITGGVGPPVGRGYPQSCEVVSGPIAIVHGAWGHDLLAMTSAVLHQGAAQVAIGKAPRLAQISDAVVDIDFRLCEFLSAAPEPEHRGRPGPDLHQANLADTSDN